MKKKKTMRTIMIHIFYKFWVDGYTHTHTYTHTLKRKKNNPHTAFNTSSFFKHVFRRITEHIRLREFLDPFGENERITLKQHGLFSFTYQHPERFLIIEGFEFLRFPRVWNNIRHCVPESLQGSGRHPF